MASNSQQNYVRSQRIPVSSAIPSAKLTLSSLPRRPVPVPVPAGSSVRLEHLYTNHFTCQFATNLPLYQYDVAIEEMGFKSKEWYEVKGRSRCALIMQSMIATGIFPPEVIVWYDEQKCLYSTSIIQTPKLFTSGDGQNR
ncbi:unnamed protein product, partial [Adineta steineri]